MIPKAAKEDAMKFAFLLALVLMLLPVAAKPATYEVVTRNDIVFAEHDGVKLLADLYSPKDLDAAPVLVGVHGGGWQVGSRKFYTNWGPYLAKNGYAVFSIEYRLMKPGVKTYPGAVYDVKAAVPRARKPGNLGSIPSGSA
jgi:acetyl esterase/lipase